MTLTKRPRSVAAVALAAFAFGACCLFAGFGLSWVSSCCGSTEPADSTPTLVGIAVAAALAATGYGLWSARMPRRALVVMAFAVPAVCVIASFSSTDFQTLVPFAVIGWGVFWWFLRRPTVEEWLGN